jgi:2-dehydropantoate 2-reductase
VRIAVIGAGGIGGYFGGRLAERDHEVAFIARGAHLEAIRSNGLSVASVAGDFEVAPAVATDDPADVGEVDAVLLGVKTWQLPAVLPQLPPLLGSDTAVITTQNGVEAPDQVAQAIGQEHVLPGVAKIFASVEAPGRIRHIGGPGNLTFGEWDDRPTERVRRLQEAFGDAGVIARDIWVELWFKLLFVVPFGTLGAAADANLGVLRSAPGTRRLLATLMAEIREVARAREVALPDNCVEVAMGFIDSQPAAGTTSLQRDIQSGRPSELEAWTGAVVRLGEQTGVATPVHDTIYQILRTRESQVAAADRDSGRR